MPTSSQKTLQTEIARRIKAYIVKQRGDVPVPVEEIITPIENLNLYRACELTELTHTTYSPSLCIVAQGAKSVAIGSESFTYDPHVYLLSSTHIPARVKILEASPETPYLSLILRFSMEQIFDLSRSRHSDIKESHQATRGIYIGTLEERILDPLLRVIKLLDHPRDIPTLAPLIMKEILYTLLQGQGGSFLRQYIQDGSMTQKISHAITKIRESFAEKIDMGELAKSLEISESSLYHNFKKVTFTSPLQFQKNLRLQEARHLLLARGIDASDAAFAVGYVSPSQFSREYARMFGMPPKSDIQKALEDS